MSPRPFTLLSLSACALLVAGLMAALRPQDLVQTRAPRQPSQPVSLTNRTSHRVSGAGSALPAVRPAGRAEAPPSRRQATAPASPSGGPVAPLPSDVAPPEAQAPPSRATRLPILEYHYAGYGAGSQVMMTAPWFEEQMRWLSANGFTTLTSAQLAGFVDGTYAPPQRSVALTFDVGISHFDDYSQVVIPTLRRYKLHGIFFVQASQMSDTCDGKHACWPALAEWVGGGLISIGSHTMYHVDFASLTRQQIAFELRESKRVIEDKLGVEVIAVCYPFDSVNPQAFPILKELGYRYAVAGYIRPDRSAHFADLQPYSLPRWYPYSNYALYPVLTSSGGLTFEEMMWIAVESDPSA